jgi:hypothetical protein
MTQLKEKKEKKGRAAMPETAKLVDELRAAYGAERIDGAIAAGQRARREYIALQAASGKAVADRWLASQRFAQGCFHAVENGIEVGIVRR